MFFGRASLRLAVLPRGYLDICLSFLHVFEFSCVGEMIVAVISIQGENPFRYPVLR